MPRALICPSIRLEVRREARFFLGGVDVTEDVMAQGGSSAVEAMAIAKADPGRVDVEVEFDDVEVHGDIDPGEDETPPSYACGGVPSTEASVDGIAVYVNDNDWTELLGGSWDYDASEAILKSRDR